MNGKLSNISKWVFGVLALITVVLAAFFYLDLHNEARTSLILNWGYILIILGIVMIVCSAIVAAVVKGVNVRGSASPVIADGVMTISSLRLRAGHLPIANSGFIKEKITADDIENEKLKLAFEAIHDLAATPDGGLKIGFYPAKISNLTRILIVEEE